jgi:NAD(P)-dependent dehydrogenase (short-subunit alcohol dehydrogenase family)
MGSIGENREGQRYVYRASKAALNMVVRTLAIDLAARGLIVTALHPGWVQTAMGGAAAPMSVAACAAAIAELVERLTPAHSGRFLDYRGRELPW